MHADLKYVESLENEIDELESDKAEFSNMYDVILQECVSNDVKCSYLMSLSDLDALDELQCLYLHKVKEYDCLAQKLFNQTESVSKEFHFELLKCFAIVEKHLISLEIALQKCSNPQGKQPSTNIQPASAPSTPTYVYAEENNNDQAEEEQLQDDEFTNPFCASIQDVTESSSHNIGNSYVPTFNQPQVSKYR
nr:hypothetical protein [Tanacetum cinerariifolium]